MEILGLAVVVVIILVATIFIVRFLVLKTPVEYRKGFVSAEIASNMLNTFLKTAAKDCSQLTMTELLQDCAQGKSITCGTVHSCEFVELTAKKIFKEKKYSFLGKPTSIIAPLLIIVPLNAKSGIFLTS